MQLKLVSQGISQMNLETLSTELSKYGLNPRDWKLEALSNKEVRIFQWDSEGDRAEFELIGHTRNGFAWDSLEINPRLH